MSQVLNRLFIRIIIRNLLHGIEVQLLLRIRWFQIVLIAATWRTASPTINFTHHFLIHFSAFADFIEIRRRRIRVHFLIILAYFVSQLLYVSKFFIKVHIISLVRIIFMFVIRGTHVRRQLDHRRALALALLDVGFVEAIFCHFFLCLLTNLLLWLNILHIWIFRQNLIFILRDILFQNVLELILLLVTLLLGWLIRFIAVAAEAVVFVWLLVIIFLQNTIDLGIVGRHGLIIIATTPIAITYIDLLSFTKLQLFLSIFHRFPDLLSVYDFVLVFLILSLLQYVPIWFGSFHSFI